MLAAMHHSFLLPISFLVSSVFLPVYVSQGYSEYEECSKPTIFPCGSISLDISYPFLIDGRPAHCGLSGYHLSCERDMPKITILDKEYKVMNISYADRVLTVAELDPPKEPCNWQLPNVTLDEDQFEFTGEDIFMALYKCSDEDVPDLYKILSCSAENSMQHWFYQLGKSFEFLEHCFAAVVPLRKQAADLLRGGDDGLKKFGEALQQGFDVRWKAGEEWCSRCLESGGSCGYNSGNPNETTCYCPNGKSTGSCRKGSNLNVKRKILIVSQRPGKEVLP